MDKESDNLQKPTVLIKTPSNILNNKFLVYPAILLLGYFLGFFTLSILPFRKPSISSYSQQTKVSSTSASLQPALPESKLPISLSLLNTYVYAST